MLDGKEIAWELFVTEAVMNLKRLEKSGSMNKELLLYLKTHLPKKIV